MSDRPSRSRRTGVASLATLAAVAALSVATPTVLTSTAEAAGRQPAQLAPGAATPRHVAQDAVPTAPSALSLAKGTVLVADYYHARIVAIAGDGTETTVADGFSGPSGVSLDGSTGDVYVADFNGSAVWKIEPNGIRTAVGSGLSLPEAVLVEPDGDLLISDSGHGRVLRVTPDGTQTVLPFTGLARPYGLVEDADGNVFVADSAGNSVYELTPEGVQSTVGGGFSWPSDVALDSAGDILVADSSGNRVVRVAPDGTQDVLALAGLSEPFGVAVDTADNVFVTNLGASSTYELTPDGEQSTVASDVGGAGIDVATLPVQVITFTSTAPADAVAGDHYTVTATGGDSGEPVTFATQTGGVCSVDDLGDGTADVALEHTGDCVIDADQAGDQDHAPAAQAHQTVTVGQAPQQITFTSTSPTGAVPGDDYTVSATGGGSTNAVTFSTPSDGVCSVDDHGDGTADVALEHTGDCVIDADQVGDDDHASADQAHQTVSVGQLAQSITFTSTAPGDALPGDDYTVSATGGDSGNPVTFSTPSDGVCSVDDHGDGTADVSLGHGGDCVVDADQAGAGDYAAAEQSQQTVTVGRFAQQVTFTSTPGTVRTGDHYTVTATGGDSGSPVTFAVAPGSAASCTVSPTGRVHALHAKPCSVVASQAGDQDYAEGSAVQTVHVLRAPQAVRFTSRAPRHPKVGATYHATVTGNPSGRPVRLSALGPCSISRHGLVQFTHQGTCSLFARQMGTFDYQPGHAKQVIAVTSAGPGRGAVHLGTSLLG